MKWKFVLEQESTKRGVVLVVFGLVGLVAGIVNGEGSSTIISSGITLAGALGAVRSD